MLVKHFRNTYMKYIKIKFLILVIVAVQCACKKANNAVNGISALNVINASVNAPSVYVYFTLSDSDFYLQQSPISYQSAGEFSIPAVLSPISIISSADTGSSIYRAMIDPAPGSIYSLYVSGGTGKQSDNLLLRDTIPVYSDSTAGVRLINLVSDSRPINVNIAGNPPSEVEFGGLAYQQISSFKSYPANMSVGGSYNFEIRDAVSDSLLATFTWNYTLFKNNTLVFSGLENSAAGMPVGVFQVNNY